jgi:small nuclear ribonucleoprotein (snRNP)-like protein
MIDRPLDALSLFKGKEITITYKDKSTDIGKLLCFDIHINLAIEDVFNHKIIFIKGDEILKIGLRFGE